MKQKGVLDSCTCERLFVSAELGDSLGISAAQSQLVLKLHPLSLAALHRTPEPGQLCLQPTHLKHHSNHTQTHTHLHYYYFFVADYLSFANF